MKKPFVRVTLLALERFNMQTYQSLRAVLLSYRGKRRSRGNLKNSDRLLKEEVTAEEISEIVSRWSGIPVSRLMEGEKEKLLRLESILHERIIGQDKR